MGRKKRYHSDVKQKLGSNFSELLSEIAPFIGPRLDIYETNDTFFITADVAGIKKEDLSVKLQDKTLIIAGAIPDHFHSETVRVFSQERYYGPFQKKNFSSKGLSPASITSKPREWDLIYPNSIS
ncbi:Hsp20/alpha crystallin family protein [Heyndrickxia sporothermodurans]|uniref:Hsp20/alpha crystallin family protein n=1 Tax=Heyndrickxia sporothermodurans TaxID=46224 RepID=A0AB37HCW9_9BACI|nr:Hsp20/alpha crystallin family protein [Heyndrickxia sporothermodurans]MBL5768696.1 Hsp20/alpha crystallin family protein [Heyndrickxia sporothermodurans]MBL5772414.1 Hsp20/alpha crystallin family protein [Heyndrickxia sporothermodurans]MBL5775949.1 Hsp20/alpha crystallin family protein [Heyndrickxia sporothermodurans]MBL5779473.1 Hsp20/alpha crystallin family protein [Heyndrickxia sporothermodurans]MBL5783044.1 Hsp20/alpha crystallin family protein [Heyndrickxia sporothermodurans]